MILILIQTPTATDVIETDLVPMHILTEIASKLTGEMSAGFMDDKLPAAHANGLSYSNIFCIRLPEKNKKMVVARLLCMFRVDLPFYVEDRVGVMKLNICRPLHAPVIEWFECYENMPEFEFQSDGPANSALYYLKPEFWPSFDTGDKITFRVENADLQLEIDKSEQLAYA